LKKVYFHHWKSKKMMKLLLDKQILVMIIHLEKTFLTYEIKK